MQRALIASFIALATSACAYRPTIVDSAADIRACLRLGEVSPTVPTTPGFGYATDAMLDATISLGGTHLYMQRQSPTDWLLVRGIAYRCDAVRVRERVIVRAKG